MRFTGEENARRQKLKRVYHLMLEIIKCSFQRPRREYLNQVRRNAQTPRINKVPPQPINPSLRSTRDWIDFKIKIYLGTRNIFQSSGVRITQNTTCRLHKTALGNHNHGGRKHHMICLSYGAAHCPSGSSNIVPHEEAHSLPPLPTT